MNYIGMIGALLLAAYLLVVGVTMLIGTTIPGWFVGLLATGAGALILVGAVGGRRGP